MIAHRRLLDAVELAARKHAEDVISTALEARDSAWSGEGASADVQRMQAARRLAFAAWCARTGEINETGGSRWSTHSATTDA